MNYLGRETGSFNFAWLGHCPTLTTFPLPSPTSSQPVFLYVRFSDISTSFHPLGFLQPSHYSNSSSAVTSWGDSDHYYLNVLPFSHSQLHYSILTDFLHSTCIFLYFIFCFILFIFCHWYYHFCGEWWLSSFFIISILFFSTILCKLLESKLLWLIYYSNSVPRRF